MCWLKIYRNLVRAGLGSFPSFPDEEPNLDCKQSTADNMQEIYLQLSSVHYFCLFVCFGLLFFKFLNSHTENQFLILTIIIYIKSVLKS